MNGLVRLALGPLAGFGAYQAIRLLSEVAALAVGAAIMLAFALLPGSRRDGFTQD